MDILFIGGTGRLSKDVARLALEYGNKVTLITRGSSSRSLFVDEGYEMIRADIRDSASVAEALGSRRFDVVLDYLTFNPSQLDSTLSLVWERCAQYVFISTATVYQRPARGLIHEDETPVGHCSWGYAQMKYECEMAIRAYAESHSDTAYTIIRPYVTYGDTRVPYPIVPRNSQKEWSFCDRMLRQGPIPVFDEGKTETSLTHTKDFAKAVCGLMGNERAFGEAVHIVDDAEVCWSDVLQLLQEQLGVGLNACPMTKEQIASSLPEYKEELLTDKGVRARFSTEKLLRLVPDMEFTHTLAWGIEDMVRNYRANPSLQVIDSRWNGRLDAVCKRQGFQTGQPLKCGTRDRVRYWLARSMWLDPIARRI